MFFFIIQLLQDEFTTNPVFDNTGQKLSTKIEKKRRYYPRAMSWNPCNGFSVKRPHRGYDSQSFMQGVKSRTVTVVVRIDEGEREMNKKVIL